MMMMMMIECGREEPSCGNGRSCRYMKYDLQRSVLRWQGCLVLRLMKLIVMIDSFRTYTREIPRRRNGLEVVDTRTRRPFQVIATYCKELPSWERFHSRAQAAGRHFTIHSHLAQANQFPLKSTPTITPAQGGRYSTA